MPFEPTRGRNSDRQVAVGAFAFSFAFAISLIRLRFRLCFRRQQFALIYSPSHQSVLI